jgi:hypothetical protein
MSVSAPRPMLAANICIGSARYYAKHAPFRRAMRPCSVSTWPSIVSGARVALIDAGGGLFFAIGFAISPLSHSRKEGWVDHQSTGIPLAA